MRTTLAIADEVLVAAKAIAREQGKSVGAVVSELARRALHKPQSQAASRKGVPLLPVREAAVVTLDLVNGLRDGAP